MGNSNMVPWRIGGKSITEVDRPLYSTTAISDDISKIEVTHGAASGITINSWTVIVSKNSDFSNPVSTLTPSFTASATTPIYRPDGKDWSNCYFKFVYNVTVSGSNNKFLEFSEAKFYKEDSGGTPTTYTMTYDANGGTGTMTDDDSPYEAGETVTVLANTFTRDNYTFTNWNTASNGSGTSYDAGHTFTINANTTLYAQWTENGGGGSTTYSVSFDAGTGTFVGNEDFPNTSNSKEAGTYTLPSATPAAGYVFYGWKTGDNDPVTGSYTVSGNVAFTAQYHSLTTTLTATNLELTGSYTTNTQKTINGITYVYTDLMKSSSNIQAKASSGTIRNTTAYAEDIESITINYSSGSNSTSILGSANGTDYTTVATGTGTFTADFTGKGYKYFKITRSTGAAYYSSIAITIEPHSDIARPTFTVAEGIFTSAQNVSINGPMGSTIYYTSDGTKPTTASTLYNGTAINISSTTTLKAIAVVGDESSNVGAATYTILTPLTSVEAIYNDITTNTASHPVAITFNDWVITGTNGGTGTSLNQFYLTDASNTYGCVISGAGSGFVLGNKLSGTVLCNAEKYTINQNKTYPVLTNLTTSTDGLSVGTGGSVTANTTTISQLSGSMTGTVIKLDNLTYNGSYLADANDNKIVTGTYIYTANLESGKTYNITGVLTWSYSSYGYQHINPRSASDIEEVVPTTPTIYATPESLSDFTYVEGNGPSATQTVSVSGTNLEGNFTLAMNDGGNSAFEMSLSENGNYSNSLTLTPSEGNVSATTVYVRMKAGLSILAEGYSDEINLNSTNATTVTISLAGTVTGPEFTWDLTTATYNSASMEQVQWTSSYATMTVDKNGANSNANAYLNSGNPVTTRFYTGQKLTFAPKSGYTIDHVEITGTDLGGIKNNAWNNAGYSTSGTTVTITPTDNSKPFYDIISATVKLTSVTVYYAISSDPFYTITIDDDINNGTVSADYDQATEGTIVTLTINPNTGYYLKDSDLMVLDDNDDDMEVTKVNGVTYTFEMPADNVTVYASFSVYTGTYYTLVTNTADLVTGRHYIIASSKTPGSAYAMGAQNDKYREQVAVDVVNNMIYGTENVHEIVLSGAGNNNYWTLYDEETPGYLHAYNSTANQLGTRQSNATNESYGQWAINIINDGVANIVSQVGALGLSNTIKYNSGNTRFSCYTASSTMAPVYLYMSSNTDCDFYGNTTISDNVTLSEANAITVKDGVVVTFTGALTNPNPANLIIEDGGQLIVPTGTEVAATFVKNMPAAAKGANDDVTVTGWKLISSPTNNGTTAGQAYEDFASVTNLTANGYLLYKYDENDRLWVSSQGGSSYTTLNVGQGYLYGNSTGTAIEFTGNVNSAASYSVALSYHSGDNLAGFNLIGNPYSENISNDDITFVKQNADDITPAGGYVLKNDGTWNTKAATSFEPNSGFLVQIDDAGYTAVISKPVHGGKATLANNDYISFTVANSQYEDVTYAWFGKSIPLNKINHRNDEIPMLYIPQNGENYAIAMMDDNTNAFNLNFEAKTTGNYTLRFKANGEFNYLHVIDRLTGEDIDMLVEGEYSFVGSPRDNANRFIVRLGYLPNYSDNGEDIFAYQNGNDIVVSGEGELQIFDVMGRMVSSQRINGVETMSTSSLQNGVYVFRLNEKTQKIVVR